MILFHVPGGRSSLGFPATVTVPGLSGCRTGDGFPWSEPIATRSAPPAELHLALWAWLSNLSHQ